VFYYSRTIEIDVALVGNDAALKQTTRSKIEAQAVMEVLCEVRPYIKIAAQNVHH
jgi:hypothetical protein